MPQPDENKTIGFLICDTARQVRKLFDNRVAKLGVTRSQWSVLVQLMRRQDLSQSELAELVEIEQPSLVRHLDRLEASGFITRKADSTDRRVKRVSLTRKSDALMEKLQQEAIQLRAEYLHGITAEERELLLSLLGKIKTNMSQLMEAEKEKEKI